MPRSPAFTRIKHDIVALVRAIPAGRVTTFRSIGEHLDVIPRQVAYIVAMLDPAEKMSVPWQRVVSEGGSLGTLKRHADGRTQAELLDDEGHVVSGNRIALSFERAFIAAAALTSAVPTQARSAAAPAVAPSRKTAKRAAPAPRAARARPARRVRTARD